MNNRVAINYFCAGVSLGLVTGFIMALAADVVVSLLLSGLVVFALALVIRHGGR